MEYDIVEVGSKRSKRFIDLVSQVSGYRKSEWRKNGERQSIKVQDESKYEEKVMGQSCCQTRMNETKKAGNDMTMMLHSTKIKSCQRRHRTAH